MKWTIPSLPRSRFVVSDGNPPVRSRKKLLSSRRTQALAVPTTCEPLLFCSGDDLEVGDHVDDPEARDQVALHRARQRTSKRPVTRSISSESLPFHLALVSFKSSPRTSLGVIVSQPSICGIGEHRPGDVADAGDARVR